MKVLAYRMDVLQRAIQEILDGSGVFVEKIFADKKYGVNWSSQGCQPVEVVEDFKHNLNKAINIATMLNEMCILHMEEDYTITFVPGNMRDNIDKCIFLVRKMDKPGLMTFLTEAF